MVTAKLPAHAIVTIVTAKTSRFAFFTAMTPKCEKQCEKLWRVTGTDRQGHEANPDRPCRQPRRSSWALGSWLKRRGDQRMRMSRFSSATPVGTVDDLEQMPFSVMQEQRVQRGTGKCTKVLSHKAF